MHYTKYICTCQFDNTTHTTTTTHTTQPLCTLNAQYANYATLITRNSTPQHAPSSSRQRTTSVSVGVPEHPVKVKPPLTIVGDVNGRIAIMVVCDAIYCINS